MYACICETRRGFFEEVRAPSSATANFRDPPPPRNAIEPEPRQWDSGLKTITSCPTYLKLGEYLDRWLAV
jgi:hypothetical protein